MADLNLLEPTGCENPKPLFLIDSKANNIAPLKNFAQHINIDYGKLQLVGFNLCSQYAKLQFSNVQKIIFEFQSNNSKYSKTDEFKGVVKHIEWQGFSPTAQGFLQPIILNNYLVSNNSNNTFYYFQEKDILNFISACNNNLFGTAFVCYDVNTFNTFISQFDLSNIVNFEIYETNNLNGFNSFIISPKDYEWTSNYEKIIFIDGVVSQELVNKLSQNSKIYLPINDFKKSYLLDIDTNREYLLKIFSQIKLIKNKTFTNIFEILKFLKNNNKNTINFLDFYFAMLVFIQLKLINIVYVDGAIKIEINDIKSALENSKIYKKINNQKNTK